MGSTEGARPGGCRQGRRATEQSRGLTLRNLANPGPGSTGRGLLSDGRVCESDQASGEGVGVEERDGWIATLGLVWWSRVDVLQGAGHHTGLAGRYLLAAAAAAARDACCENGGGSSPTCPKLHGPAVTGIQAVRDRVRLLPE